MTWAFILKKIEQRPPPKAQGLSERIPTGYWLLAIPYISNITGMIIGRRPVVFWIRRFRSTRTRSFTMP